MTITNLGFRRCFYIGFSRIIRCHIIRCHTFVFILIPGIGNLVAVKIVTFILIPGIGNLIAVNIIPLSPVLEKSSEAPSEKKEKMS